jgi:hypothetical protein
LLDVNGKIWFTACVCFVFLLVSFGGARSDFAGRSLISGLHFFFIKLCLVFVLVVHGGFLGVFFFLRFPLQSAKHAAVPGPTCYLIRVHLGRLNCAKAHLFLPNHFSHKP